MSGWYYYPPRGQASTLFAIQLVMYHYFNILFIIITSFLTSCALEFFRLQWFLIMKWCNVIRQSVQWFLLKSESRFRLESRQFKIKWTYCEMVNYLVEKKIYLMIILAQSNSQCLANSYFWQMVRISDIKNQM